MAVPTSTRTCRPMTTNCEQEKVTGAWVGKGAERLGIAGHTIEKNDSAFEALRLNQHPDGSGKLTPRNVDNSIRFFDFQCSAQKSVSVMAVMRRADGCQDGLCGLLPRANPGVDLHLGQGSPL